MKCIHYKDLSRALSLPWRRESCDFAKISVPPEVAVSVFLERVSTPPALQKKIHSTVFVWCIILGVGDGQMEKMETESESIDITSLQLRALAPLQVSPFAAAVLSMHANCAIQTSEQGSTQQINAAQTALQRALSKPASGNHDHHLTNTIETSALPSTVPESEEIDVLLQSLPVETLRQIVKKMSSQNDATQELSPTELDLIVSKSRSVLARDNETQHTLNDGDEGHIDITSSFVQRDGSDEEGDGEFQESQHAEFSPTQTQSRLPQFPESQRFKTPATAGRKRDYSGNTKETPELPRLPDLRNGQATPAHVMGLSQAFAATQAATSPFVNGVTNPLSDRPSPNVGLDVRPATATTSSPMRPISEFRRATTEPASRYVSAAESQAERDRRALLNLPDDESDDDFSEEPSHIQRQRRQRERELRIKEQLRLMSSPTKRPTRVSSGIKSSPVLPAQRSSPSPAPELPRSSQRSPIQEHLVIDDIDESEAETEQEDDIIDEPRIDRPMVDEEDKENDARMVQIPQTTVRLQRVMNGVPSQLEQSPSLRHGDRPYQSSAPVAVANSQPSQPYTRSQRQQPKSSSHNGVDFVPQSQAEPSAGTMSPFRKANEEESGDIDHRVAGNETQPQQEHSSAPAQLGGTIPETSSSRQAGQSGPPVADQSVVSRSMSNSNFETAPSRVPPPSTSRSNLLEMSSPPIVTTPPGRKRKRMADISEGPSPQQSTQGFDPAEALHIDSELVGALDQSPIQARKRRRKTQPSMGAVLETHATPKKRLQAVAQEDELVITPPRPNATFRSGLRRAKLATATQTRTSLWDVEDSPEKQASSASREPIQQMQMRRSLRRNGPVFDEAEQLISQGEEPHLTTNKKCEKPVPHTQARQIPRQGRQTRREPEASIENIQETGSTVIARPTDPVLAAEALREETPSDVSRATLADEIVAPDMVFACFNGKSRAYYPARCLERIEIEPIRYKIQWEGYDPDEVDAYGVKAVDIRVGDHVKIDMKGFAKVPYVVRGFKERVGAPDANGQMTDIRGYKTILVAPKQRKSLPADISTETIQEAPISAIYLDNNMWNQMKSRSFEFRPQVSQIVSTSGYATPMEGSSTPSTPSSRSKRQALNMALAIVQQTDGIFTNMVFAISYDDAARKNAIVDFVLANGGTIIRESFTELLQAESIDPKPHYANLGFTALLADKLSRKEKYMQALALGLPCLSGKWIEACVSSREIVDWQTYLLPAGESDALDGAIRSRVMPQMNAENVRLADMLQSRPRPLEDATVSVVVGRGKAEAKKKPYLFLIQALGVHTIEKVADLKAAKEVANRGDVDWLFVEDRDVEVARSEVGTKGRKRTKCNIAGNELIVQSLILGRLYDTM